MAAEVRWLMYIFIIVLNFICRTRAESPHRKFEYKYSFKPPYLAQKDGSVPFWEYGGNAIASSENVRVAPSLRSQTGAIWSKEPINFDWWEVDLVFRITGRGRIGADGLAFWYTSSKGNFNGSVFGSSDQWNGLGIFFDSFDNDNKHNNPYILAVLNDGTKTFDHFSDGETQLLAGCLRDFRNKPFATRAKIEYYKNTLTLLFHGGMTNSENDYEVCFRAENIFLPENGYFGISAATGALADDHDVLHILTTSLLPPGQLHTDGLKVSSDEEAKISQEYQDYQKKLEQQREIYRREHPEAVYEKDEEWFESDSQRELRQIFSGQSQIIDIIRTLNNKFDEIVGKQERTLSLMSQIQVGGIQVTNAQPNQPLKLIESIRREEVDILLSTQNNILNAAHEIRSFVTKIQTNVETILNSHVRNPTAQVQPVNYDYQSFVVEIRDGFNILKRDISQTNTKLNNINLKCPNENCLSTTAFLILITIQMVVLLGYNIYRDKKVSQAKKFY